MDGFGGPRYLGTGCFHRREVLCGKKYSNGYKNDWNGKKYRNYEGSIDEVEEKVKHLASCSYEKNTQWGKEVDLFTNVHRLSIYIYLPLSHSHSLLNCRWV